MFKALFEELDRFPSDVKAQFWWRDDDATKSHPALFQILQLAKEFAIPIHLSVIPALMEPSLCACILESTGVIFQHGYSHNNFDSESPIPSEFPTSRSLNEIVDQIAEGRCKLEQYFDKNFQAVFVPPMEPNSFRPDSRVS